MKSTCFSASWVLLLKLAVRAEIGFCSCSLSIKKQIYRQYIILPHKNDMTHQTHQQTQDNPYILDYSQDQVDLPLEFTSQIIKVIKRKEMDSNTHSSDEEESFPYVNRKTTAEYSQQISKGQWRFKESNGIKKNGKLDVPKKPAQRQRLKSLKQGKEDQQRQQRQQRQRQLGRVVDEINQKSLISSNRLKNKSKDLKELKQNNSSYNATPSRPNAHLKQDSPPNPLHLSTDLSSSHYYYFIIMNNIKRLHKPYPQQQTRQHQRQTKNIHINQLQSRPQTQDNSLEKAAKNANNRQLTTIIKQEIQSLQSIIHRSKDTLQHSKRQQKSIQKLVNSDYLPLSFNYQRQKSSEPPRTTRRKEYRKEPQDGEIDQKDEQLPIQLPLHHFQSKIKQSTSSFRYHQTSRSIESSLSPRGKYFNQANQNKYPIKQIKSNTQKLNSTLLGVDSTSIKGHYRSAFDKEKEYHTIHKNKAITNRIQSIQGAKDSNHNDYLPKNNNLLGYNTRNSQQTTESRQKDRKKINLNRSLQIFNKSIDKVTITINSSLEKYANVSQQITPYHTPKSKKHPKQSSMLKAEEKSAIEITINRSDKKALRQGNIKRGWQQLKEKVSKYEFVRNILTQTDIYYVYEYLRKNNIRQEKWPIFVVEQACKKMNSNKKK